MEGKIDDIQIESLRQVRELFLQFRGLYRGVVKNVEKGERVEGKQEVEEVYIILFRAVKRRRSARVQASAWNRTSSDSASAKP